MERVIKDEALRKTTDIDLWPRAHAHTEQFILLRDEMSKWTDDM